MSIINRKVVRTRNYRLLNLEKFLMEEAIKPSDVIGKVCVDVMNQRIFVIVRPFQVYAGDYNPYYQVGMDLIWYGGLNLNHKDFQSKSVSPSWYILDSLSSYQIVSFKENLESVPFIDDLFGIKYDVRYNLLTNLFIECAESLIRESPNLKTTSTSRTRVEQMEYEYLEMGEQFGNDMPTPGQRFSQGAWVDEMTAEFSDLPTAQIPTDTLRLIEMGAGETSTSPF